jgi:hypothetical protein
VKSQHRNDYDTVQVGTRTTSPFPQTHLYTCDPGALRVYGAAALCGSFFLSLSPPPTSGRLRLSGLPVSERLGDAVEFAASRRGCRATVAMGTATVPCDLLLPSASVFVAESDVTAGRAEEESQGGHSGTHTRIRMFTGLHRPKR